jgi:hypothetical protein
MSTDEEQLMSTDAATSPNTIVLIHGPWMTPPSQRGVC